MSGTVATGDTSAIVRQGLLRKLKTMKKKYFVLRAETTEYSARLEYYESEKKFRSNASPRRVIPLKSCYNITRRLDLKQKHVIALFTREEQFCVVAENEKDLHAWLAAILKQHRSDDNSTSEELLHPIQHVWQVNIQKKGLGASKNIQGLYNLCLTDKTLTLVKIKSHNNVISDLGIPERVVYSLKNIRRCGDSECFFYMEVGSQTVTGAGEIWMHSEDSNIAQSMHSTILHAMKNCAKKNENYRDHIFFDGGHLPARSNTYTDGSARAALSNDKGLCVGACVKQCVCSSGTNSVDDSGAVLVPLNATGHADYQPQNNLLIRDMEKRMVKHHRTVSLPAGCALFQEPLKIVHERTRSAPLTGDELDRATVEKVVRHSSCKTVNGTEFTKKPQWCRRASTGTRLYKLSPAHAKNTGTLRSRSDSMPSGVCVSTHDAERPASRHNDFVEGLDTSRDETDAGEWHRTPRIPEEPDYYEMFPNREFMSSGMSISAQRSRTSSMASEETCRHAAVAGGGGASHTLAYTSMTSGADIAGTPSTDSRFSEYQLDRATSHIGEEEWRPSRAYSVGSRPGAGCGGAAGGTGVGVDSRHRAYSVGARCRSPPAVGAASASAPLLPRHDDLMELDFTDHRRRNEVLVGGTPPSRWRRDIDEYVDMSPRDVTLSPFLEARAAISVRSDVASSPATMAAPLVATTPDGYVEMNYSRRTGTRPIAIAGSRPPATPVTHPASPATPINDSVLGSQTIFPLSPESESSEATIAPEDQPHPLTTLREISEEGRRSPDIKVACSPRSYVELRPPDTPKSLEDPNSTTIIVKPSGAAAPVKFSPSDEEPVEKINYADLDLEPRTVASAPAPRLYTQIDFVRSEKLHADAN